MCAYFFAAPRVVHTDFTSDAHKTLKTTVTSPLFSQLPESVRLNEQYKFNRTPAQLAVIKDCTQIAQQKLQDCKAVDKEAALALAFGVAALATGWLPFTWIIMPMAFIYSGYLIKERAPAFDEYTKSLKDLVLCAQWAINNEYTKQADMEAPEVEEMLNLLQQVMTKEQLKDLIVDGPLEDNFINTIAMSDEDKEKTLEYKVYGFEQGGSLSAIATKIGSYIHNVMSELAGKCVDYVRPSPAQSA